MDWWTDDEARKYYILEMMADTVTEGRDWDGVEAFNWSYDDVPVRRHNGEWWVTDSDGEPRWPTGVPENEAPNTVKTVGQLARALNLEPWSLAADYGWSDDEWPRELWRDKLKEVYGLEI